MSQTDNISAVVTVIGTDIKDLKTKQGQLTSLTTTHQTTLVGAINEVNTKLKTASVLENTVDVKIQALKEELIGGASDALNSFKELETALETKTTAQAVATQLSNKIDKTDIGDTNTDFVQIYNTAKGG